MWGYRTLGARRQALRSWSTQDVKVSFRLVLALAFLVLSVSCRGGGGHSRAPMTRSVTTASSLSGTARPTPSASPTIALPTPVSSDEGALRAAWLILHASNPPYRAEQVTSARYVRTSTEIAYAIVQPVQRPATVGPDQQAWLFVFSGTFVESDLPHGRIPRTYHTAFVVVQQESEALPGRVIPVSKPYDLSPAGVAVDVPSSDVAALARELSCHSIHTLDYATACPTPPLLISETPVP